MQIAEHDLFSNGADSDVFNESDFDFDEITPSYYITEKEYTNQSVCQSDQRVRQVDTSTLPYKAICKLYLKARDGKNLIGTGFLTHSNKLYTAGHCVYDHKRGGWMKGIVVIPGMTGLKEPFGRYRASKIFATAEWINNQSKRFDMGCIKLDNNVAHSDYISASTSDANEATVCGYPGDRDTGIFQYRMRDIVHKSNGQFRYQIDTFGGMSGAPLLSNARVAIGIHNYGGCDNAASDLTQAFIDRANSW